MVTNHTANLSFEDKLWQAADKLRGYMDPSEYKHVVLGLIFLKYISDSFENRRRGELVDSELGMIPKGLRVGKVKDHIDILTGYAFKSEN